MLLIGDIWLDHQKVFDMVNLPLEMSFTELWFRIY